MRALLSSTRGNAQVITDKGSNTALDLPESDEKNTAIDLPEDDALLLIFFLSLLEN